jgi:hypothetical protein
MNLQAVLQKTEKGVEEVKTRSHKLEQRLRMLLIVVNGKATGAQLAKQFETVGDITPLLERLVAQGFVREASAGASADFREIRTNLAQALTDALGPAGEPIVMQLEACKSAEEVRAFVDRHRPMLEKMAGPRGAAFLARTKQLLG